MNGIITTYFEDKGFGFIRDEEGDNRYFHVVKVQNPELIKKNAEVTFEPGTNLKGLSAFAVKVIPPSTHVYIANEKIKITSIKDYRRYTKEVKREAKVDKENAVLSVGLLMNRIRPQDEELSEMRTLECLDVISFQGKIFTFTEDEIDINETVGILKNL